MPVIAYPDLRDYHAAVQNPASAFTIPCLRRAEFVSDSWGPVLAAGRSAVVFHAKVDGAAQAVRCYTRQDASTRQHYAALSRYVALRGLTTHVGRVTWHDAAIRVNEQTWPVLQMDWIDGQILDQHISHLVANSMTDALGSLAELWRELVRTLQAAKLTHGDLQHGNVILDDRGQLRLVDFDGVWIPPLASQAPSAEIGHENYQPPGRSAGDGWGPLGDTFSALVIYVSLIALSRDPGLWPLLNDENNLLFQREDFIAPFETDAWRQLARIGDPEVDRLARLLRECCVPGWTPTSSLDEMIKDNWWDKVARAAAAAAAIPSGTSPEAAAVLAPLSGAQQSAATAPEQRHGQRAADQAATGQLAAAKSGTPGGTAQWWLNLPGAAPSPVPVRPAAPSGRPARPAGRSGQTARPAARSGQTGRLAGGFLCIVVAIIFLIVGLTADAGPPILLAACVGCLGGGFVIAGLRRPRPPR